MLYLILRVANKNFCNKILHFRPIYFISIFFDSFWSFFFGVLFSFFLVFFLNFFSSFCVSFLLTLFFSIASPFYSIPRIRKKNQFEVRVSYCSVQSKEPKDFCIYLCPGCTNLFSQTWWRTNNSHSMVFFSSSFTWCDYNRNHNHTHVQIHHSRQTVIGHLLHALP